MLGSPVGKFCKTHKLLTLLGGARGSHEGATGRLQGGGPRRFLSHGGGLEGGESALYDWRNGYLDIRMTG